MPDFPKKDYVTYAVRSFYIMTMNLKRLVSLQLVVLNTLSESNDSIVCPPRKMRASAGGRKKNVP